jgi:GlpG protein
MRQIGHLETDKDARVFCDFLYVQGIENEAERDGSQWAIWIRSDDDLLKARQLLDEFKANPGDARFMAGSPAAKLREQEKKQQAAYEKRVIEAKAMFPGLRQHGFGVVTYALIAASIIVFLISRMGNDLERVSGLLFSVFHGMPEIRSGQVWRLVTPIIIHFGFAHILFNMLWLRDLGSMFEARLSSWYFAVFVVVAASVSNFAQFIVSRQPIFGGMSGVVYALIGYVWIRGRFDPGAGLQMDRQSVIFALVWFVICFTGWVGPIANGAHAAGLILGVVWAFVDSKLKWR